MDAQEEVLLSARFDIDGIDQFTFEILHLERWKKMESLIKRLHWIEYPISLSIDSGMHPVGGEDFTLTSKQVLESITVETDSKVIAAFRLVHKGDSLSTDCNLFDLVEETLSNIDIDEEVERQAEKEKREQDERRKNEKYDKPRERVKMKSIDQFHSK